MFPAVWSRTLAGSALVLAAAGSLSQAAPAGKTPRPAPRRTAPAATATPPYSLVRGVVCFDGTDGDQSLLIRHLREALDAIPGPARPDLIDLGQLGLDPRRVPPGVQREACPVVLRRRTGSVVARVAIPRDLTTRDAVRRTLAALGLPVPPVEAVSPGVVAAIERATEKTFLRLSGGEQRSEGGLRLFGASGYAIYRIPVPEGVRRADLRCQLAGPIALDIGETASGPWSTLFDGSTELGPLATAEDRSASVSRDLGDQVRRLPGALYVRARSSPEGKGVGRLDRVELVARADGEPSREAESRREVEERATAWRRGLGATPTVDQLIGGALTTDLKLVRSHSPYYLTRDLIVPHGRRLTVEPGVEIKVVGSRVVRSMGLVTMIGAPDAPIVWTAFTPRQPDEWRGMILSTLDEGPGPVSRLDHCRITHAATGLTLVRFRGEVTQTRFDQCATGVSLSTLSQGKLDRLGFQNCVTGLLVDAGAGSVSTSIWEECGTAIEVRQLRVPMPTLEGNSIRSVRFHGVRYPGNSTSPPFELGSHFWGTVPDERRIAPGSGPVRATVLDKEPANAGPSWPPTR